LVVVVAALEIHLLVHLEQLAAPVVAAGMRSKAAAQVLLVKVMLVQIVP
jgi:hypothetical protein